ncbi:MAG: hypothetical protein RDV41_09500 [Planctomycetota bacterium]|nr:hypothetical protein [Planctomycetota bacterium]
MHVLAAAAGPTARSVFVGGIIGLFIGAAFLLLGASVAGIERRSYGRALIATFFSVLTSSIVAKVLWHLPLIGIGLASLGGFLVAVLVTQMIFDTTYAKALVAAVIYSVLYAILTGGMWLGMARI